MYNLNNNNIERISKENYEIIKNKTRQIKKFSAKQINYDIKFKNISNELIESINMIEILFKSVIKDITDFLHPDDNIKVFIDHPNFSDDIQTKFMKVRELDAQTIIDTIARIIQSGKILSLDEKLEFSVLIINHNQGGAGGIKRVGDFLYKKQCVVRIKTE